VDDVRIGEVVAMLLKIRSALGLVPFVHTAILAHLVVSNLPMTKAVGMGKQIGAFRELECPICNCGRVNSDAFLYDFRFDSFSQEELWKGADVNIPADKKYILGICFL